MDFVLYMLTTFCFLARPYMACKMMMNVLCTVSDHVTWGRGTCAEFCQISKYFHLPWGILRSGLDADCIPGDDSSAFCSERMPRHRLLQD